MDKDLTPQGSMAERIRNRNKPATVPTRDGSFTQPSAEIPDEPPQTPDRVAKTLPFPSPQDLSGLIQVADRRQIRLEVSIDSDLETLCRAQKITVETLLEAAYLEIEDNPDLKSRVIAAAKVRLSARKRAGNLRRIQTQLEQANFEQ
jgi:hypothetical protein